MYCASTCLEMRGKCVTNRKQGALAMMSMQQVVHLMGERCKQLQNDVQNGVKGPKNRASMVSSTGKISIEHSKVNYLILYGLLT